jgi:hypothetical protein
MRLKASGAATHGQGQPAVGAGAERRLIATEPGGGCLLCVEVGGTDGAREVGSDAFSTLRGSPLPTGVGSGSSDLGVVLASGAVPLSASGAGGFVSPEAGVAESIGTTAPYALARPVTDSAMPNDSAPRTPCVTDELGRLPTRLPKCNLALMRRYANRLR